MNRPHSQTGNLGDAGLASVIATLTFFAPLELAGRARGVGSSGLSRGEGRPR